METATRKQCFLPDQLWLLQLPEAWEKPYPRYVPAYTLKGFLLLSSSSSPFSTQNTNPCRTPIRRGLARCCVSGETLEMGSLPPRAVETRHATDLFPPRGITSWVHLVGLALCMSHPYLLALVPSRGTRHSGPRGHHCWPLPPSSLGPGRSSLASQPAQAPGMDITPGLRGLVTTQ